MSVDPLSGGLNVWQWAKEHWYVIALVGLAIGAIALIIYLWRSRQEDEPRRDAVKRAMREVFESADASGTDARVIVTLGNAAKASTTWGVIYGVRETSHAIFVKARPMRGIFKWFLRRRFIVARHLVADTHSSALEVAALGMTAYEGVWIPDDDFHSPAVAEEWRHVLIESGFGADELDRDLPSCVLAWYLRIIRAETFARAGVRALDDTVYNWRIASSHPIGAPRRVVVQNAPNDDADQQGRDQEPEQHA